VQKRELREMSSNTFGERPALEVTQLRKTYGATLALDSVTFDIGRGSVHALLGENGAGKSTFVKLLNGLTQPDAGKIRVFGDPVTLRGPRRAHHYGIRTAFQELTLCPDLTVFQNFLLPDHPQYPWGTLKAHAAERDVRRCLSDMGLRRIDPSQIVKALDLATRQKLEIARAVYRRPRILLLDEPTASLSGPDIDWLDTLLARLRGDGVTTLFISHRLPEVRRFCDTLTVLRNGKVVQGGKVADATDNEIIESIIGRSLTKAFPPKTMRAVNESRETPVLEARSVCTEGGVSDASFKLFKGEIVGVAALQGMGQQELMEALFGAVKISSGEVIAHGNQVRLSSPRDALAADVGIGFVPEERKTDGLFLKMDGKRNTTLPVLSRFSSLGAINRAAEHGAVKAMFQRVQVVDRAIYAPMESLSGGNQQKVAIAKWLITESPILLLLDPTRGVDVGTKHEIYLLMQQYAAAGGAVLFYSTEIEEIVHMSHRVLVMYRGRISAELTSEADQINEQTIMAIALGGAARAPTTTVQ
jgi:ribose transport system ATP-binding protein